VTAHGKRRFESPASRRVDLPAAGRMVRPPAHPANDNPIPPALLLRRLGAALVTFAILGGLIAAILILELP
jgi:hypothetical protein